MIDDDDGELRNETWGAFHFAKSNSQKPVKLLRENGMRLFDRKNVLNQSHPFLFQQKCFKITNSIAI